MKYSIIVKKVFEFENIDEIIKNEINFFFFLQQTFFILSLYLTIILLNLFFGDTSFTKTFLLLITGFCLFIFSSKNKFIDRYKNRKNIKDKYVSNFIFKIILNHYQFKIMKYLTGRYDIYKLILSKMSYLDICESLLKNDKINDETKKLIESFLTYNIENMTSSDVFYMARLDPKEHYTFSNLKNIIEHSKKIKLQKIQENIKNY